MFLSLRLLPRAIRLWWREFPFIVLLNFIWLVCQVTIVFAAPATAALVYVARRIADEELIGLDDFWAAFKANFTPALRWAVGQWLVYGVLAFNLYFYREASGLAVLALRYAWTLMAFLWFAINLYFWPLHFEQADQRFRTTLGNAAKMALLNPNQTIIYALAALLLTVFCVGTGAFLGFVLGAWLSLWGVLVARANLELAGARR